MTKLEELIRWIYSEKFDYRLDINDHNDYHDELDENAFQQIMLAVRNRQDLDERLAAESKGNDLEIKGTEIQTKGNSQHPALHVAIKMRKKLSLREWLPLLKDCSNLESFSLESSGFYMVPSGNLALVNLRALTEFLQDHCSLRSLNLEELKETVVSINNDENDISERGVQVTKLLDALSTIPTLRNLTLPWVEFKKLQSPLVHSLADFLAKNKQLETLNIYAFQLCDDEGVRKLFSALQESTLLSTLHLMEKHGDGTFWYELALLITNNNVLRTLAIPRCTTQHKREVFLAAYFLNTAITETHSYVRDILFSTLINMVTARNESIENAKRLARRGWGRAVSVLASQSSDPHHPLKDHILELIPTIMGMANDPANTPKNMTINEYNEFQKYGREVANPIKQQEILYLTRELVGPLMSIFSYLKHEKNIEQHPAMIFLLQLNQLIKINNLINAEVQKILPDRLGHKMMDVEMNSLRRYLGVAEIEIKEEQALSGSLQIHQQQNLEQQDQELFPENANLPPARCLVM